MSRAVAIASLAWLLGCPMAPAEPTPCDRLVEALESRRLRCIEPPPEEPLDCAEASVRDPNEALTCVAELETARCDEPISARCAGQLIPR